jgi:hypothetical protein
MPERFTSGLYGPDLVKAMGEALDLALAKFKLPTREARKVLADAIIEGVDAGERDPVALADKATHALRKAIEGGLLSE